MEDTSSGWVRKLSFQFRGRRAPKAVPEAEPKAAPSTIDPLEQRTSIRGKKSIASEFGSQPFRFRDLPEELQCHCLWFCLPADWSIRAFASLELDLSTPRSQWMGYHLRFTPRVQGSLLLVDKRMSAQVYATYQQSFTGEIHLDRAIASSPVNIRHEHPSSSTTNMRPGATSTPMSQSCQSNTKRSIHLDLFLPDTENITTIHMGYFHFSHGFSSFDLRLIEHTSFRGHSHDHRASSRSTSVPSFPSVSSPLLPNLYNVVAHSETRLLSASGTPLSLYGWGDASSIISYLSDTVLLRHIRAVSQSWTKDPKSVYAMRQMWERGIRTLLEIKVNLGGGGNAIEDDGGVDNELGVSFYCVIWVRPSRKKAVDSEDSLDDVIGAGDQQDADAVSGSINRRSHEIWGPDDAIMLGKYPVDKWLRSSQLRRKVYAMTETTSKE